MSDHIRQIGLVLTGNKIKRYTLHFAACIFLCKVIFNYSALIAPVGQAPSQAPQSMHAEASTTYFPSPSAIAPTGQVDEHDPQLTQLSSIT